MGEIALAVRGERRGQILLVPEQYSHEAERELASVCGDRLSLYAEALSFTGLARRVEAECGGALPILDRGGRLLCMARALEEVGSALKLYGGASRSPELQLELLAAVDELKQAAVTPESLEAAAKVADGILKRKLTDLALIYSAYDAVVGASRADPADRLTALIRRLPQSELARCGHIYIDGFTDFTAEENALLLALLPRGADFTFCFTLDDLYGENEIFELSRRTARRLIHDARALGIDVKVETLSPPPVSAPDMLAEGLFNYTSATLDAGGAINLLRAQSVSAECELAASKALELARNGARWRDIAIAVRGFEDYRLGLDAAFSRFGVPIFTARKTEISQKPLPALIASAYDVILGGWEADDVLANLRTGLAGLTPEDCDELENYCIAWGLRARHWLSPEPWRLSPEGSGLPADDAARERLAHINELRRRAAAPLIALANRSAAATDAMGQARALAAYFDELGLSEALAARADELEASGRLQAADEYARLWDAAVSALEQAARILGTAPMDAAAFSRLYLLTLSQYDVGVIPVSLDMVTAGDMDRMRRRHIKHLIVLGASDERLPMKPSDGGVFSMSERRELLALGVELYAGEAELWREYTLIYNCLSLPSDTLTLITPAHNADGSPARPAFPITRAEKLFGLELKNADPDAVLMSAKAPALELAAAALRSEGGSANNAAARYFAEREPERLISLAQRAKTARGSLSRAAVRQLYGERLRLSASRVERLASCRFAYFLNYGLRAKPRRRAELSPPEFGSFMHYVLQHTAEEARERGGFAAIPDKELDAITDKYVERYIDEELGGLDGRSARFRYLFTRLAAGVRRVVAELAAELRDSDFEPLDFELDFSRLGLKPEPLPQGGSFTLTGIADRIDGWLHEGRLYLRVVDYKTGRKSFSLSDVWYGLGLQMLLYLFALEQKGAALYGRPVEAAGVMYVPARDLLLSLDHEPDEEELTKKRAAALKRSGLLLDVPEVLHAMERGDEPKRLPIKWKNGVPSGDALASAERFGKLAAHIRDTLSQLARELESGSICADPYYKGAQDNACLWCDYADACRFNEGEDGDRRRYLPKLPAERVWNALEGGEGDV